MATHSESTSQVEPSPTAPSNGNGSAPHEVRFHYPIPDDAAPLSCDIWEQAFPGDHDEGLARRLHKFLVDHAFGTEQERAAGKPLRFFRLSEDAIEVLSPDLRSEYEFELKQAADPRSGDRLREPAQEQSPPPRHAPRSR